MNVPRSVDEVLARRPAITAAGARAIGRRPVGAVSVPLLVVPWREDGLDRKEDDRG